MEVPDSVDSDAALAIALKSLSHPKRLRLLRFATEPRSLEEISSHLKVARQSAKEHLDRLLEIGLLEARSGRGDHGPVTKFVVVVSRLFDIFDRFGTRAGLVAADLGEDVRRTSPTTRLPATTSDARRIESPRLIIVHGMRVGQTISLQGNGPWLIGRDPGATLCLDYDSYVSHRHAEVRRSGQGFEIADALSSNGLFVDWIPGARGGVMPLQNGSLIRFGKTLVLFRIT